MLNKFFTKKELTPEQRLFKRLLSCAVEAHRMGYPRIGDKLVTTAREVEVYVKR